MNTKVEEALADLDELETYFAERADVVDGDYGQPEPNEAMRQHAALSAAIHAISIHIAQQDATIARLTGLVHAIGKCSYPVCTSIDPRGHRWSEAYLDKLRPVILAAALNQGEVK